MKVTIKAIHFDATAKLEQFIQKKVTKLEQYSDGITAVDISLKVVKPESADNKEVLIKALIPNNELVVTKNANSFEEAFDSALEALIRQLVKIKGKTRS